MRWSSVERFHQAKDARDLLDKIPEVKSLTGGMFRQRTEPGMEGCFVFDPAVFKDMEPFHWDQLFNITKV